LQLAKEVYPDHTDQLTFLDNMDTNITGKVSEKEFLAFWGASLAHAFVGKHMAEKELNEFNERVAHLLATSPLTKTPEIPADAPFVKQLSRELIEDLRLVFSHFDANKSGTLTRDELLKVRPMIVDHTEWSCGRPAGGRRPT
jgi:hypothetical protein